MRPLKRSAHQVLTKYVMAKRSDYCKRITRMSEDMENWTIGRS